MTTSTLAQRPPVDTLERLEPLRQALLAGARHQAELDVAQARGEGEAEVVEAQGWVRLQLVAARGQGRAAGAELAESEVTSTRQEAQRRLQRARREVYEELVLRSQEGVRGLLADPARRRGLDAWLRAALGGGATVTDTADGGLWARDSTGVSIDASVQTLTGEALLELDLEGLWTPR